MRGKIRFEVRHMKRRLILLTGISGAGKTTTMGVLEDMGYHCIDQFPVSLLKDLRNLIVKGSDPRFDNVVISMTLQDFDSYYSTFRGLDIDLRVVFLEASHDELLKRYKSTRRNHPLLISNKVTTLEEALSYEEESLKKLKDTSFTGIDTTFLKGAELKNRLNKMFNLNTQPIFSISFVSFGYKNGVPLDADLLFDVRFLPNPFWDENLREHTGEDLIIKDFVMSHEETKIFIKKLKSFLDYAFKEYVKEGKNHFTVGIGCTGGKHRSVVLVDEFFEIYKQKYHCFKEHRDLQ
jgi:RNase adapter protein RapZ